MSVGRQLAKTLIDTAADMRRYSSLLLEFEGRDVQGLDVETLLAADRLEGLVTRILVFEGENYPALTVGKVTA